MLTTEGSTSALVNSLTVMAFYHVEILNGTFCIWITNRLSICNKDFTISQVAVNYNWLRSLRINEYIYEKLNTLLNEQDIRT